MNTILPELDELDELGAGFASGLNCTCAPSFSRSRNLQRERLMNFNAKTSYMEHDDVNVPCIL